MTDQPDEPVAVYIMVDPETIAKSADLALRLEGLSPVDLIRLIGAGVHELQHRPIEELPRMMTVDQFIRATYETIAQVHALGVCQKRPRRMGGDA